MFKINPHSVNLSDWVGNTKCAEVLIKNGANIDPRDPNEEMPVETAVTRGSDQNLSILIQKNNTNNWFLFIYLGHDETAEMLIKHGANVVAANSKGRTLLHTVSEIGQWEDNWIFMQIESIDV